MLSNGEVVLRKAKEADLDRLWTLFNKTEWKKFDAPYWARKDGSKEGFQQVPFQKFVDGKRALLIEYQGDLVGTVTAYWEDEGTRWLEVGITIHESGEWSKGIGRTALIPWITHLFDTLEVERIGLTTWSGNPRMIACAKAIGMQVEGQLRKVRYYEGVYYDSVKMGVLREEWVALYSSKTSMKRA